MPPFRGIDVRWYSKYVFLVGAILSFADPITDILTLDEFYRADHKTWFAVGLGFVVLPWVPFGFYYVALKRPLIDVPVTEVPKRKLLSSFLIGFNPFSAAVARLEMFVICLKNENVCRSIDITDRVDVLRMGRERAGFLYSKTSAFFEAVLESAPQFVIQLYVMNIQDERINIIQLISLPVSFLSLVWTFTSAEELVNTGVITNDIHPVKHKCFLFVTNLFLVSSRLFAIGYFTVSYKWWIISVLMIHSITMMIVGYICSYRQNGQPIQRFMTLEFYGAVELFGKFCVQWLKDDLPFFPLSSKNTIRWIANALFVVENVVMILLFYFSGHYNTWYALPVAVCVCSFTVLGAIMRIAHFYLLQREKSVTQNVPVESEMQKSIIPSTNFQNFYYYYETAV